MTASIAEFTPVKKQLLHVLQAARGIAAILVVFYHDSFGIFNQPKYWGADPLYRLFHFGEAGVEFFFVLSGFIIFHVHWADIGKPDRVLNYIKKRVLRIYPIYWVILPVVAFIYAFLFPSSLDFKIGWADFFSSALLVHFGSGNTILIVAWTLFHEMLFYGLFALIILNKQLGSVIFALWMFGSFFFINSALPHDAHDYALSPARFFFSPLHLLFAAGMVVSWLVRRMPQTASLPIALIGMLLFATCAAEDNYVRLLPGDTESLIYGLACSVAVWGTVNLEIQGRLKVSSFLVLMGGASYAIYLVHFPLLSVMAKFFFATGAAHILPPIVCYVFMALAAIIVGTLTHVYIERPLLKYLHKRSVAVPTFSLPVDP